MACCTTSFQDWLGHGYFWRPVPEDHWVDQEWHLENAAGNAAWQPILLWWMILASRKIVHSIRSARCLPIHGMNILIINSRRMAIRTEELWCFVPIFLRPCRILTFWRMAFIACKMLGSWQRTTICCVNIWDFKARICGQTRPPRGLWWL